MATPLPNKKHKPPKETWGLLQPHQNTKKKYMTKHVRPLFCQSPVSHVVHTHPWRRSMLCYSTVLPVPATGKQHCNSGWGLNLSRVAKLGGYSARTRKVGETIACVRVWAYFGPSAESCCNTSPSIVSGQLPGLILLCAETNDHQLERKQLQAMMVEGTIGPLEQTTFL